MRELSQCFAFCQFSDFLIYISVRFLYISVTLFFTLFFLFLLAPIRAMPFSLDNLCHEWHLIDFKRFFSVMSVAKTCHACHKNGKSLIFKGIFIVKCGMSLLKNAWAQIIITSYLYAAAHLCCRSSVLPLICTLLYKAI